MEYLPKAKAENIVIQDLEKETLIYDLNTNKAFCLNETSALVWQFCDGQNSITEISRLISKKFKMNISEDFVWLALNELQKDNLLEKSAELTNRLAGLRRREMVKQVGLASMIALPVIASIMAPSAAQAQSGCYLVDGRNCDQDSHCCSGVCKSTTFTCGCLSDGERCNRDEDCCDTRYVCNRHFYCGCVRDGDGCTSNFDCCSLNCNGVNICGCRSEGESCQFHQDCCDGNCNSSNVCQPCLPAGRVCMGNEDCCSGFCGNVFGIRLCLNT